MMNFCHIVEVTAELQLQSKGRNCLAETNINLEKEESKLG